MTINGILSQNHSHFRFLLNLPVRVVLPAPDNGSQASIGFGIFLEFLSEPPIYEYPKSEDEVMQNNVKTMNWIEAINLSLTIPEDKHKLYDIIKEIKSALSTQNDRPVKLSLYRSTRIDTNWAIHLKRDTTSTIPAKTGIGKNFAGIFSQLGRVEHAIWKKVSV